MPTPLDHKFPHPRVQKALELAAAGFRVFPLIPGGKTPAIDNWPERATTNSETILKWWTAKDYNIGIATGPHPRITTGEVARKVSIVVDYDMKPGQQGAKNLWLHTQLGYCDTLTSKTPHGIHKFYWADASLLIPNSVSRIAINVDVRGARGYVVGPGSTVDGVDYEWIGEHSEPIEFPAEFVALAAKPTSSNSLLEHGKLPIGEPDRPHAIAMTKAYLINEAPEAISGSHGDQTTFQVACRCKDFGLSEAMTFEMMSNHWNEAKAFEPWTPDELRIKVSNAYKYGRNPPGSADPLNEFGDDVENSGDNSPKNTGDPYGPNPHKLEGASGGGSTREPLKTEDFDTAAENALDTQSNALIAGLIGQGELCAIYGPPGSGKTFVAFDLAYAVASGPLFGGRKTRQGGVLYVAAEGGPSVRSRVRALKKHHGATTNPPLYLLRYPIDFKTGDYDAKRLGVLIEQLEKDRGIKFLMVVIDTLSETLAGGNDTEHMQAFIYNAKLVQQKTGATVVAVHHPGKDVAKGMRGHTSLVGAVDTAIEISAPNGLAASAKRKMTVRKQRNMEIPEHPNWFTLSTVAVGPNKAGEDLSSCVVIWSDVVENEFDVGMSETDKITMKAVEQWATATGNLLENVQAAILLEWLAKSDKDNPVAELNGVALRKRLSRLRKDGFLAGHDRDEERDEESILDT